jgi:nitrite reductase/ring-hydroxylating ferredoxin subunit
MQRRRFIKMFAFVTAWSTLSGKSWKDVFAAEIHPLATSSTGTLRLKLQDFPALQTESGSVRLGINALAGSPPNGPMPNGQFYPVIINRAANNTFFALNSRCTHQNCVVDAMDPSTNQMTCPCHGSVYGIDGRRISGQALSPLTRYTVNFDGQDRLSIQIPSLGYSVTAATVPGESADPRVRLDFRALRNVEYEVLRRESLGESFAAVPFSTTVDGSLDQTIFSSTTTRNVSLFVGRDSATAFYVISVRVAEV